MVINAQGTFNVTTARTARPSRVFSTLHAIFWAVTGVAALGYVSVIAITPSPQQQLTATVVDIDKLTTETKASLTRAANDINAVKADVAAMRKDIDAIKVISAQRDIGDRKMLERLTALEEKQATLMKPVEPPPTTSAPVPPVAPRAADPRLDPRRLKPRVSELKTGTVPPPKAPAVSATPTVAPLAPEAIPSAPANVLGEPIQLAPPTATAKPQATVRQRDYGVRLASANSLEELRLSWSSLNESGGDVLGNLKPRYQKGGGTVPYQLVAGPFKSEAEAVRACQALAQKGLSCAPTSFHGQGL
jgi:hypothetical protein